MNKNNFFDIEKIRDDFPIFKNIPKFIYFDNASTTQKPNKVINAISDYYENYNANVHRGIYEISERSTQAYENDPGDSDGDGVSMFPGAYMVSNKHYPTYNDALNDTNGTTC